MKKLIIGILGVVFMAGFANAKEGNNSRIQQLEAEVAELKSQVNPVTTNSASEVGVNEVIKELCYLYDLTGNQPPLFCRNCGNNNMEIIEECDDGNTVEGDGCSAVCLWEKCGNGIIDFNEECDDGNEVGGDGCSFACTLEDKKVFLTSIAFDGGLEGLAGADAKCSELANQAGLNGTYKAWLSDSSTSVSQRFTHSGPYKLVDGTPVADTWEDLTDGYLLNRITRDEKNTYYASQQYVWTNTLRTGEKKYSNNSYNCNNWTSNSSYSGGLGSA